MGSNSWKHAVSGTYADKQAPRCAALVFALAVLLVVLLPLVGMLWARTDSTTENHQLAELPQLQREDGSFNEGYLMSLGDWFSEHFAYRNEAVDANAHLRALLGTSATDQVVLGSDGWLYYGGTLPDYLGQSQLSERSLAGIAHNLKLAQRYAEAQGARFAFTLAPNKNTLDAQNMPYYYLRYTGASNAERLKPYLDRAGVNYVDLFEYFGGLLDDGEPFHYLKQDSHWDNYWALLAADRILQGVGAEPLGLGLEDASYAPGFVGDLESMLYPMSQTREGNYYFAGYNDDDGHPGDGARWSYSEGSDVTDSFVRTVSAESDAGAAGTLLMFRDSFGNALLPYLAAQYEHAAFSKLVPYNLTQLAQTPADCVVVERAERHLSFLATDAPFMPSPRYPSATLPAGAQAARATAQVTQSGSYWVVSGVLDDILPQSDSALYVKVSMPDGAELLYDPFWISFADEDGFIEDDSGYQLFVPVDSLDLSQVEIAVYFTE